MSLQFITTCINSTAEKIHALQASAQPISYRTAQKRIGRQTLADTFPTYDWDGRRGGLTLKRDWHVGFYRGTYEGHPVYFVEHSGIEYIFG